MDDEIRELELYHKHYTDLFIYQARQRIDSIRFFMLAVAVLASAIAALGASDFAKTVLALVGGLVTLLFLRLDYRNSQIVDLDEKPLRELQKLTRKRMGGGRVLGNLRTCREQKAKVGIVWNPCSLDAGQIQN